MRSWLWLGLLGAFSGCLRPAQERAELDQKVGRAAADGVRIRVDQGHAAVRAFDGSTLTLWAQAPTLRIHVALAQEAERSLRLEIRNCMPDAVLTHDGETLPSTPLPDHAASCSFTASVRGEAQWLIAPARGASEDALVFGVLSDVQNAIGRVEDIFARMNEDPALSFVVSTGDLVEEGARHELVRFQDELARLAIPLFSTVGNHEMGAPARHWHALFGPFNVHFTYAGVTFSLVDSGNATIDPIVYGRLDGWLEAARDETHVVLTHYPPIDPVGLRGGGFRNRNEAAKFLQKLGAGRVDALFLGHVHSYYAFSGASVPTYISGGGGAIPERLDGIARHYLRVRAHPVRGIEDVAVIRID